MTSKLGIVIAHEFKVFAANRTFVILTILGPFLIIGLSVLPTIIGMSTSQKDFALTIVGDDAPLIAMITQGLTSVNSLHITVTSPAETPKDRVELDRQLLDKKIFGYVLIPGDVYNGGKVELVTKEPADFSLTGILEGVIGNIVTAKKLGEHGIQPNEIASIMQKPTLVTTRLESSGKKSDQDFLGALYTGLGFAMLLYMTTLLYGQSIGRSVLVEKTSKTVEVMLSSVKPLELLFGKILGQGIAGLIQYAIWIGMADVFFKLFGSSLHVSFLSNFSALTFGYLVVFFLLGFFLYAALYSIAGAAADDEQNLSQLAWPFLIFLMLPLLFISTIILQPNSSIIVFFSIFPLTSPIVMFIRIVITNPPLIQIVSSIVLLLLTIVGMTALSAKIFPIGILMSGRKFTMKDIRLWLKG